MALAAHFTRRELVTSCMGVGCKKLSGAGEAACKAGKAGNSKKKQVMQGVDAGCVALLRCSKTSTGL
jgi:hypothetical protein